MALRTIGRVLLQVCRHLEFVFFPLNSPDLGGAIRLLHILSALVLFLTLAYISRCRFTKTDCESIPKGSHKAMRNMVYTLCAYMMITCIVAIVAFHLPGFFAGRFFSAPCHLPKRNDVLLVPSWTDSASRIIPILGQSSVEVFYRRTKTEAAIRRLPIIVANVPRRCWDWRVGTLFLRAIVYVCLLGRDRVAYGVWSGRGSSKVRR